MSRITDSLLGLSTGPARSINTYPAWRYLLIAFVIALGAIYAAPNLFPPDYALQIRAEASDATLTPDVVQRATAALDAAGIHIRGTEVDARNAVLRMDSNEDQLRGRDIVQTALQEPGNSEAKFVVALNLASTTPRWLQNLGGKPMSYGLDLSGGVHFLLEVDMAKAIGDRMVNEEDNIRRILREARLRYVPANNMVDGTRISLAFYDAPVRDEAQKTIQKEYRDFQIQEHDVD